MIALTDKNRLVAALAAILWAGSPALAKIDVRTAPEGSGLPQLAAREVTRYLYLRTGVLPEQIAQDGAIVIARKDSTLVTDDNVRAAAKELQPQQYLLKTTTVAGEKTWWIVGGDDVGALYGAYRFAEKLGVRFYLHGDVVPDERLKELPVVNETGKPLFPLRGVNPWGWHPQGIDAWSADDYKAVITQLAKMRMNFLGIHCYPENLPMAEPAVWHGLRGDFDEKTGRVNRSYLSRYYNSLLEAEPQPNLPARYLSVKTSDFHFGGAQLFDDEGWAPDVLRGMAPLPSTPDEQNEMFNRMAAQFKDAFTFARQLGVKTAVGTETPLRIPQAVAKRSADVRAVYEGTFRRIMASHPLDYYWLWTPEPWTWSGNNSNQYAHTVADLKLAIEAARNVNAPFRIATAGWVLGPQHDRAALDKDLPKDVPLSAINRNTGLTEVDPAFGNISGRELWAIPWLESDWHYGLATIQLHAGRMRRDAADALAYGSSGLMGLHWRTEDLAPNASALAFAAWNQNWSAPTAAWSVPGQIARFPQASIANTQDAPLYQTVRYDLGTITAAVPAGNYRVTLKFCEPHFDKAGERICDVRVQGKTVIENLDILAQVGKFAALDYTFEDVAVTKDTLTIELVARKSLPCISAIAVESAGFTTKINLGGAAHKDWQADPGKPRSLPVDDFYADFAQANFGLPEAGEVFAAIDGGAGYLPKAVQDACPTGAVTPDATPWANRAPAFAFMDEFERLRPRIKGAGNLHRFDYWLNMFKYHRALAQTRCAMGARNPAAVLAAWAEAYTRLLETANTQGAFGMVVNMETHQPWTAAVAKHVNQPFPKEYQGAPRLIVPCVRSVVGKDEARQLKIIALLNKPVESVTVHLRPMGQGAWKTLSARHVARAVFEATLPPTTEDCEYFITAGDLVWPATAPTLNQTVIVTP